MIVKICTLLISFLILTSCSKKDEDIIFFNQQFKNELDKFLEENSEPQKIIYLTIADGEDIFENGNEEENKQVYLIFYFTEPDSCVGFYKSFEYKYKQIILYDFSDKIKFSDLLKIRKGNDICSDKLLTDMTNTTIVKRYYFNEEKKLIEIKKDGTLRKVE